MRLKNLLILTTMALWGKVSGEVLDRPPLSYAPIPVGTYVASSGNGTTLLDFVKSREDLTTLASIIEEAAGFREAFATTATWDFTFFAPSDTAFNNTGDYFQTFAATDKGKWWLGNLLQHHYVPFSQLKTSAFSSNRTRIQTGTFLFIGTQVQSNVLTLNNVAKVTAADNIVNKGIIHIIDHVLDPSAMIFEPDLAKTHQAFIPGSCSDPSVGYC